MRQWILISLLACFSLITYAHAADTLQAGVVHEPPFVIIEGEEFSGLSINLWKSISLDQGSAYELVVYNDHLGL